MKAMDLIRTLPLKGRVEMDIPMKELTTLRVGGKADCVVFAGSESDVEQLALFCADRDVPLTVVGRGSNLLVRDGGLSGVVLLMGKAFADVRVEKNRVYTQAGATLGAAARAAQQAGLAGLEFAEGIPGSVGGGVLMNAGAYGGEMKDVVESVVVYYIPTQTMTEVKCEDCGFDYRRSNFGSINCAIMGAVFHLTPDDPEAIGARMKEMNEKRVASQPLDMPSAGSAFKRPVGGYAAALIDQCGLKGYTVGGAQISEKHAGFAVNAGGATYDDVVELLDHVRREVYAKTQITLEPEIKIYPKGMMLVDDWRIRRDNIMKQQQEYAQKMAARSKDENTEQ